MGHDEQSLHNGYILVLKKSFKMGIFFNPQHKHPGKFDMKSPPPPPGGLYAYLSTIRCTAIGPSMKRGHQFQVVLFRDFFLQNCTPRCIVCKLK